MVEEGRTPGTDEGPLHATPIPHVGTQPFRPPSPTAEGMGLTAGGSRSPGTLGEALECNGLRFRF